MKIKKGEIDIHIFDNLAEKAAPKDSMDVSEPGKSMVETPKKPIDITKDDWTEMLFEVPGDNKISKSKKPKAKSK